MNQFGLFTSNIEIQGLQGMQEGEVQGEGGSKRGIVCPRKLSEPILLSPLGGHPTMHDVDQVSQAHGASSECRFHRLTKSCKAKAIARNTTSRQS